MASSAETVAFLREVRLFKDVAVPELSVLGASLRERALKRGQVLFREGDVGEEMFLVRQGSIVISKPVTGRVERAGPHRARRLLRRDGPVRSLPRSATVQSDSESSLLVLDREGLRRLTEESPRAAAAFFQALVQVFIERLRASGDPVAEVTRWGLEATGLDLDAR